MTRTGARSGTPEPIWSPNVALVDAVAPADAVAPVDAVTPVDAVAAVDAVASVDAVAPGHRQQAMGGTRGAVC
ncbi:hypothetical protein Athai_02090 [Actinocatenispora thailandica]|uniref:Uncharacterized protein n=1 Tax=Actinocatenispora thailandica TaxID=227318 RepID=A0A7R7HUQ2_9ACTN|nr:hypothetical protein Athai_02090 [Actinocatenispora thailandica]